MFDSTIKYLQYNTVFISLINCEYLVISGLKLCGKISFCCSGSPLAAAKMQLSGLKSVSTPCCCGLHPAISLVRVLFP